MIIRLTILVMAGLLTACTPQRYNEPVSTYEAYTVYGMDPRHGLLAHLPTCDDPQLWRDAQAQFNSAESNYGTTGVLMNEVISAQQAGAHVKYNGKVGRGWCEARAVFSDGLVRRVKVELGSGLGFAGTGYGLSICVHGLDRHKAYAPNCRALRWREF